MPEKKVHKVVKIFRVRFVSTDEIVCFQFLAHPQFPSGFFSPDILNLQSFNTLINQFLGKVFDFMFPYKQCALCYAWQMQNKGQKA